MLWKVASGLWNNSCDAWGHEERECREKKTVEEKKNKGFEGQFGGLEGKKRDHLNR